MRKQIYEISFWAINDFGNKVEETILQLLDDFKFKLLKKNPLKIKNLAYPINNHINGEFGTIYFEVEETDISKMKDFHQAVKNINNIIRFIILKKKRNSKELAQILNTVITNQEHNLTNIA
ncbi:MAG: hypothetical protein KatS3mg097_127 [Candidatus Parcubacteria bacterium]|nr:MAG: hypothetical protein KatS3mg097_127 [Candidatus Parcubacteria bacterium]